MTLCSVLTDGIHAHGCISISLCEQVNIFGGGRCLPKSFYYNFDFEKLIAHVMSFILMM